MIATSSNARFEDDYLFIDGREQGKMLLRFGPYSPAGMSLHRWSAEFRRWVTCESDPQVCLVNAWRPEDESSPVRQYLTSWPQEFLPALRGMRWAQCAVMQLLAKFSEARDLLLSNPVLLWLAAAKYVDGGAFRKQVQTNLRLPQTALLSLAINWHLVRPEHVKFLRKLELLNGDRNVLIRLRGFLEKDFAIRTFRHWPRITCQLLEVDAVLVLARMNWLRERLAVPENTQVLEQLSTHQQLLLDVAMLLEQAVKIDAKARRRFLASLRPDWTGLQVLHDELVAFCQGRWSFGDIPVYAKFGPSPLPLSCGFEPITSLRELREEGDIMHHCAATRARRILSGVCYLYRVTFRGERATVQIGIRSDGLVIDEIRLKRNALPSAAMRSAVQAWVDRAGRHKGASTSAVSDCGTYIRR